MSRIRLFHLCLTLLLVFGAMLPARVIRAQAPDFVDHVGGRYWQMDVTLRATPQPDGTIALAVDAMPYQAAPELSFVWELPDGGELLDGDAIGSAGRVAARSTAQQSRRVRFPGPGTYAIRALSSYRPDAAVSYTAAGVLFVTIDAAGGITIADQDPRLPLYVPPRVRPTLDKSDRVVAADADMTTDGCFYVTGILTRNERAPSVNTTTGAGFYTDQGGSARPVHHMLVEMREEDTFSDDSYGYTVTNDNGKFEFRFCDDDGFLNDELELYYRVCAEVWDGPDKIARVTDIDDRDLYCFDSRIIDSEGGTVDFDLAVYDKNSTEAAVFNIGDAIYYAWRFWNDNASSSPRYDRTANVLWQRGSKRTGSFYNDTQSIMVIADDASSTDEWDDSVIIHEWGHFADHQFSCNQNPGGAHSLPGINNGTGGLQLSWGEGYPDYYQSAARTIMPGSGFTSFYVDPSGPTVDLEVRPGQASDRNEGAIAALMWDFADAVSDGQDTVNHGHAALQRVLTDPAFRNNAQCDMRRFLKVWKDLGLPADAATAATVVQNVNINLSTVAATAAAAPDAATQPVHTAATNAGAGPLDYRWWDQVTMVVDNSTSMAGGVGIAKLDAVKQVIGEQVNDYTRAPQGTEFNVYTFDGNSPPVNTVLEGRFFADPVNAGVGGIAAVGADYGCYLGNALDALQSATVNKAYGNAWLYTDGDTYESYRVNAVRQHLTSRGLRGSTVLLGGCGSPATAPTDVTGGEKNYLELAADGSQPSGMVSYLLTALGSGGQFLYVAPDQLADAVAVLRAQLSHTAGAGRWSDYVSDTFTYRYDQLQPFEYQWFPAESLGQDQGQLSGDKRITLPAPFSFYGETTDTMDVSPQGVIRADPCTFANPDLCSIIGSTKHIDVLNGNLQWDFIPFPPRAAAAADAPDAGTATDEYGTQVHLYTANFGIDEWFIISTQGTGNYGLGDYAYRAFQVWLNLQTGEIRFQYGNVRDEAGTSQIGLRFRNEIFDFDYGSVIVSKDKLGGAYSGMGYKFTPAPPQPTKTYVVNVDPLIDSVVFLQTGYSGSFEPMIVRYPDGTPVDCADTANVQCVTLNGGLVQFVQVNTNGVGGEYQALIDAGPTGSGTFSFNAMAASAVGVTGLGQYSRSFTPQRLRFDFGRTTDDGLLTGWFQRSNGVRMGDEFMFYDDGAHDDGEAGDGRFGSDPYTAPLRGITYLWVNGSIDANSITRSDPVPYDFQPLEVTPVYPEIDAFFDTVVPVGFNVTNQADRRYCFYADYAVPTDWEHDVPQLEFCLESGETLYYPVQVWKLPDGQPSGISGEVSVSFTEWEEGKIGGSAGALVRLHRAPVAAEFDNRWETTYLRPNGTDMADMTLNLIDDLGQVVGWSGQGVFQLNTTLGTVNAPTDIFADGRLPVDFTAGTTPGVAEITGLIDGGLEARTTVPMEIPHARTLDLVATPTDLRSGNDATLVVTVLDPWGDPVAGAQVRLSAADDDGEKGAIEGEEAVTRITAADGTVTATFTKAPGAQDSIVVRAELLSPEGNVLMEDAETLILGEPVLAVENEIFLPLIQR